MSDPNKDLSWRDIITVGLIVAALSGLVLLFGGLALKAYARLRYDGGAAPPYNWWWIGVLVVFSLGGAIAIGTISVAWRWMHRKRAQPQWGMAFVLLAVILFGLLVWPTPWKYKEFGCKVYHLNRFVGGYRKVADLPSCEPPATAASVPIK